eukprot:jgi/Bigna1/84373/fgenesh1_pg.132_\
MNTHKVSSPLLLEHSTIIRAAASATGENDEQRHYSLPKRARQAERNCSSSLASGDRLVDVIVVGGGAAGMSALRALSDYKDKDATTGSRIRFRPVLLEARDRMGGRVHTITLPERKKDGLHQTKVDLGANYIHGAHKLHPIFRMAKAKGEKLGNVVGGFWEDTLFAEWWHYGNNNIVSVLNEEKGEKENMDRMGRSIATRNKGKGKKEDEEFIKIIVAVPNNFFAIVAIQGRLQGTARRMRNKLGFEEGGEGAGSRRALRRMNLHNVWENAENREGRTYEDEEVPWWGGKEESIPRKIVEKMKIKTMGYVARLSELPVHLQHGDGMEERLEDEDEDTDALEISRGAYLFDSCQKKQETITTRITMKIIEEKLISWWVSMLCIIEEKTTGRKSNHSSLRKKRNNLKNKSQYKFFKLHINPMYPIVSFQAFISNGSRVHVRCKKKDGKDNQDHGDQLDFFADYVICTVPIGVLKSRKIHFAPPIREEQQRAIDRMGSGAHNKAMATSSMIMMIIHNDIDNNLYGIIIWFSSANVILRFAKKDIFWPKEVPNFNCLDPCIQWLNMHAYGKEGVLVAHVWPPYAYNFKGQGNDDKVVEKVMETLQTMFRKMDSKSRLPCPVDQIVTRWDTDPFSLGSYSFLGVESQQFDPLLLSWPHPHEDPRCFFAGEATSLVGQQCVYGAVESGRRAVKELICMVKNVEFDRVKESFQPEPELTEHDLLDVAFTKAHEM